MYLKIPKDCLVRQYDETAFGYGGVFRPNIPELVDVNDAAIKAEQSLKTRMSKINVELDKLDAELRTELENRYSKAA